MLARFGTMVANVGRMIVGPVRERGWVETFRSVRGRRLADRRDRADRFDERFGTDTVRTMTADDLTARGEDVVKLWCYAPTTSDTFADVLADTAVRHEDFTFADLGSGKGRALLLASHYPFQRLIGVEIAPSLHAIAEQNVRIYHPDDQRCHRFELVCMDAGSWSPPPDSNLLVYLFQPFPADVFDRVMANLRASARAHPRQIVLAYLNPIFDRRVVSSGFLHRVRVGRGRAHGDFQWAIYSNRPEDPSAGEEAFVVRRA